MTDLSSEKMKIVGAYYTNLWSLGELDIADTIIHPEFDPDWIEIPKKGAQLVKHEVSYIRSVFDKVAYTIMEMSSTGNKIWIRYSFTGMHNGPAWHFKATRKPFKTEGVDILTIEVGKIRDRWASFCMYDVFHQLDLIPAWYELANYDIVKK